MPRDFPPRPDAAPDGLAPHLPGPSRTRPGPDHRAAPPAAVAVRPAVVAPLLDRSGPHAGRPDRAVPPGPRLAALYPAVDPERGEGPSVRQLAHAVGMRSPASVACHLAHLERSGALIRDGRGWNTCRLGH
ncbi:hypothetical protein [Streptomyces sp. NRRL S-813]|uniref:LexA family protein n=1 Tax=Streptomyces sp. NRRL S-813 TaxID=1463919 RepID=UPI00099D2C48